jgi:dihydrofolate reductase
VITSRKIYDGVDGWGDDGFYRMPVFVLTHRTHDVVVKGETTFTFVTDGIESAIAQARAAAGDKKVHVMGGASVIQQALQAGLVDSLHLHVAPVVLGAGTRLFDNLTDPIGLERIEVVESQFGTHLRFRVLKHEAP